MTGEGEGKEGTSSPRPLHLQPFFCFRSNFRAITRMETLATQARGIVSLGVMIYLIALCRHWSSLGGGGEIKLYVLFCPRSLASGCKRE